MLSSACVRRGRSELTKGVNDKHQFSDVEMLLVQPFHRYHIENEEDEEVDILDITSDRGYL